MNVNKQISNTPSKHVYPDNWPQVTCGGDEPDVTSPGCVGERVLHNCVSISIPTEFLKDNLQLFHEHTSMR